MSPGHPASHARRAVSPSADQSAVLLDGRLAHVRHDLRNALMPLMLHFDLLDLHARGCAPRNAAPPAELTATLQRLANGLLFRATEHAADDPPTPLDLHGWWSDVGELLSAPLRGARSVDVRLRPHLPHVLTHADVLAHVFLHVFVDVRLAQPASLRPVVVSARRTAHGVTMSIHDAMRPMSLPRPRSTHPLAPHWGLSLAQSLLHRAGCSLSGYSTPEDGTHLSVHLRTADGTIARSGVPGKPRGQRGASGGRGRPSRHQSRPATTEPQKVLIIDDNAALTTALGLRLELHGAFTCLPPLHALHDTVGYITRHQPDIVLLDLNLPGEEQPLEVLRAVRSHDATTRLIVLTGNPSSGAIDAARAAGADAFVAKGVTPERLLSALQRAGEEAFVLELDS